MSEENFASLIPQRNDSADIVRVKQAHAAARLIEPAVMSPLFLEVSTEWDGISEMGEWQPVVANPIYFRKALVWGARLEDGQANTIAVRLRHGDNANRIVNPGEMIVIEALPGQKLNLQGFFIMPGYGTDVLAFELY